MIMRFVHRFIKDADNTSDAKVREAYGTLGSSVGVGVNLLLSGVKFVIGMVTGSVAIVADAANNLSDAGGSIVSLISVRLAAKPVDQEHPYGHGRLEYIGALGVGLLILLMAIELFKSGIEAILNPSVPSFGWIPLGILLFSIVMKLWLFVFYNKLGKATDAATLLAAAKDSLSDVLATSAVLISMILGYAFGWAVDGWMGVLVALIVLKAGVDVCRETIDSLMGGKPNKELGRKIIERLMTYNKILGVHDLMIHDYGPGRCFASVHAEVPADGNILELHEIIDTAEREIGAELHLPLCIHMDPIVTGDAETDHIDEQLNVFLHSIDPQLKMHDLRRVPGAKQTNLIFDVVVPAGYKDEEELRQSLSDYAKSIDLRNNCVIHFDLDYYD